MPGRIRISWSVEENCRRAAPHWREIDTGSLLEFYVDTERSLRSTFLASSACTLLEPFSIIHVACGCDPRLLVQHPPSRIAAALFGTGAHRERWIPVLSAHDYHSATLPHASLSGTALPHRAISKQTEGVPPSGKATVATKGRCRRLRIRERQRIPCLT